MTELERILQVSKDSIHIDFESKIQFHRYIEQNNIIMSATYDMYGYLRALGVLGIVCNDSYLLTERFDGLKQTFPMYDIKYDIRTFRESNQLNKKYKIVNVKFDKNAFIHYRSTDLKYNPTYRSILDYVCRYWLHSKNSGYGYADIVVQNVRMSEQQFIELQAKLNMISATWRIVDYNTIAVLDDKQKKIFVYTMQAKVIR
jgi:hypothetical protein